MNGELTLRRIILVAVCVGVPSCGARTGLDIVVGDASVDAPVLRDAAIVDVAVDVVTPHPARVFVTASTYQGDFGGLTGADAICQKEAAAAKISGTYRAWLSDSTGSPSTRFAKQNVSYVRVDGAVVAANWTALTSGTLAAPINLTASGDSIPATDNAWTETKTDGTPYMICGSSCFCLDWTATYYASSSTGKPASTDATWTDTGFYQDCGIFPDHLYCFEQ